VHHAAIVLKIVGRPYLASASYTASRQKSTSMVIESRHASTRRLNLRDIHGPHLIGPIDH